MRRNYQDSKKSLRNNILKVNSLKFKILNELDRLKVYLN